MIRLLWLTTMLTGCLSVRNGQTARPLGKGNTEVALDGGTLMFPDTDASAVSIVQGNVGVRLGLTDRTDFLGEIGLLGLGLGIKGTLTGEDSPIALAIAPRVSVGTVILFSSAQFTLPVLVGIPIGEHEITLAPRVDVLRGSFIDRDVARGGLLLGGGTVGIGLQAGPVRLTPELGMLRAFRGQFAIGNQDTQEGDVSGGSWVLQPNLFVAFQVGGGDR